MAKAAAAVKGALLKAKVRAAKMACQPAVGRMIARLTHDRIRNRGIVFDTSHPAITASMKAKLFWNIYESAEIKMVRRGLAGAPAVVELGSSLGICAAHIAAGMPAGGRLVCVEADSRLIPVIEERLQRHAAHLETTVIHAAVTSPRAAAQGHVAFARSSLTTASRVDRTRSDEDAVEAPALTLSHILREHAIEEFALVSDIEGAEAEIILQDSASLERCQAAVFEFHDAETAEGWLPARELRNALVELGFGVTAARGNVALLARARPAQPADPSPSE
jgi:FkbM family methyltransferase